jgi:hypothetical protein
MGDAGDPPHHENACVIPGWCGGCAPKETSYPAHEGETFMRRV